MQDTFDNFRAKVRKAIDDIAPSGTADSFVGDVNNEIDQALEHAATSLLRELPIELLEPALINNTTTSPTWNLWYRAADGSGYIDLPNVFLRFVSLKIQAWNGTVSELMEPSSNAEKMQRSKWSRGSNDKPKAMLDTASITEGEGQQATTSIKQVLRYWPGGDEDVLETLLYIPKVKKVKSAPSVTTEDSYYMALKDECEKNLIYLACRIFLEGKKEHAAADKFAQLATI